MESPEDRGGGKRPRSQHPIRTTIQGLSGDVDRDLQIQNLLAAGTSSGGNGGQHRDVPVASVPRATPAGIESAVEQKSFEVFDGVSR